MQRQPDPWRSRVVLAGTSDYEHHIELPRLPAIRNNLVGLEEAFTNPATGIFTSDYCTVIDTPDSPKSFMQRLGRAAREAEDVFLAYYAGHGLLGLGTSGTQLYLSVRETDPQQLDGTGVPFEWVRNAILISPAEIRVLILDCCFSGRAIGAMSDYSAALEQVKITGTTILTSTTANEVSLSMPGERYTAFTAELLELLTKPSNDSLSLGDLYRPLSAAMARRRLPSPKIIVGDSSGSLILRRPPSLLRTTDGDRINSNPSTQEIPAPEPLGALSQLVRDDVHPSLRQLGPDVSPRTPQPPDAARAEPSLRPSEPAADRRPRPADPAPPSPAPPEPAAEPGPAWPSRAVDAAPSRPAADRRSRRAVDAAPP
ncbi:MAG: Caspase protein, partial [Gammaproteobacteria bacterium]|nr:Caspase protein [Gammaproteobacteria bacterium]